MRALSSDLCYNKVTGLTVIKTIYMSINAKMIIFSAFLVVFISGVALLVGSLDSSSATQVVPEKSIGGELGYYGCLGSAGYSWNKDVNACVREWELTEIQKQAAREAVEYVGYEKGVTIIQVQTNGCSGCFMVEIEKGGDRIKVTLENYKVAKATTEL